MHRRVVLVAMFVVSLVPAMRGAYGDPPTHRDPLTYGGRTLDAWVPLIKSDLDPETRFRGMLAVGKLGRVGAAQSVGEAAPDDSAHETIAFQAIREAIADEPVPIVRSAGYFAVLAFGESAWPVLASGFESPDPEERRIVIHAVADFFDPVPLSSAESQLAGLPTAAELDRESRLPSRLTKALVAVMADDRVELSDRETATRALGGIFRTHPPAGEADAVRAAAIELAQDSQIDLAVAAIRLLGQMGDHVGAGLHVLTEFAGRNERLVASRDGADGAEGQVLSRPIAAVQALGSLGAAAEAALPALEKIQAGDRGREVYTSGLARRAIRQIRSELANKPPDPSSGTPEGS